jgi:hypothetical protein
MRLTPKHVGMEICLTGPIISGPWDVLRGLANCSCSERPHKVVARGFYAGCSASQNWRVRKPQKKTVRKR